MAKKTLLNKEINLTFLKTLPTWFVTTVILWLISLTFQVFSIIFALAPFIKSPFLIYLLIRQLVSIFMDNETISLGTFLSSAIASYSIIFIYILALSLVVHLITRKKATQKEHFVLTVLFSYAITPVVGYLLSKLVLDILEKGSQDLIAFSMMVGFSLISSLLIAAIAGLFFLLKTFAILSRD